jgi:two-component system, LytTR family, sensor kinase
MLRKWVVYVAGWTLVGLFFGSQALIYAVYSPNQPWQAQLLRALADWYTWALLAPLIVALGRRFPISARHRARSIATLAVAGVGLTVAKILLRFGEGRLVAALDSVPLRLMLLGQFHLNYATFWAILGISAAFDYYRKFRERELRASQLETRLAQAQLEVLRIQLQPHFLFNTLHTISALMQEGDIEAADRMIARLGELLRLVTDHVHEQEVPLRQEMEIVERYLEIQQIRFSERLRVHLDVAPDVLDVRFPQMLLQPIVENAIRHGVGPRAGGGTLWISAKREGEHVRVVVEDDGVGLRATETGRGNGVGLANTRARLEQMYGNRQKLQVGERPGGGTRVEILLPDSRTDRA